MIWKIAVWTLKVARLKVKELSNIGAFLDWGLAKDLLLPFKEQTFRPKVNDSVLVALYKLSFPSSCTLVIRASTYSPA